MKESAPTVRHVLGKLTEPQLKKVRRYADTNRFSHSWYWHGPEGNAGMDYKNVQMSRASILDCACALAVAFDVGRSKQPANFWGAQVDDRLMKAMAHLSKSAEGDVGTVNYILELSALSHDELVSIVDDSLSGNQNLDKHVMARTVHEDFVDRTPPALKSRTQVPTLTKVLSALPNEQLSKLLNYSLDKPFHAGWYWFGPEGSVGVISEEERFAAKDLGDPIAVAFELTPSRDPTSWRGCKLDEKFSKALAFWAEHAGGEIGMEDYVVELNSLSTEELERLVRSVAAEALRK